MTDSTYPVNHGVQLLMSTSGSSGSFVSIGIIDNLVPPEIKNANVDFTNHATTVKVMRPSSVTELTEMEFQVVLSGSPVVSTLTGLQTNKTINYWKIIYPNVASTTLMFQAFVNSFKVNNANAKSEAPLDAKVKLQPTDSFAWS